MYQMKVNKMCISCGKEMTEKEAAVHESESDCPSIDFVEVPEVDDE